MPLALLILTISAFAIGTTEFVIVAWFLQLLNNFPFPCLLPGYWCLSMI